MSLAHPSFKRLLAAAAQLNPPIRGPSELARAIDEAPQTITNWGGRKTGVSHAGATKVQTLLGISASFVRDGIGPMLIGEQAGSSSPVSAIATSEHYVRVVDRGAEGDMGDGRINDDYPEVIRSVDYTRDYIRSLIGYVPPPGRLVLVTGRGDSMVPVISPGESLLVDTGVQSYDGDGIYLINTGNGQQIKALQDRGDAVYVVSANPLYPAFPFPHGGIVGGKLYIKNKIERFN